LSDWPISIGERRALSEDDCSMWTPRELLVQMLRQIDEGSFSPDGIVVCYFWKKDDGTVTGMKRSKTTVMQAVAMIEMAKYYLLHVE
jgi:hypothetical protein